MKRSTWLNLDLLNKVRLGQPSVQRLFDQIDIHQTIRLTFSNDKHETNKLYISIPEGGPRTLAECATGLTGVTVTGQPNVRILAAVEILRVLWSAKDRRAESRGVPYEPLPSSPVGAILRDDFETRPEIDSKF